MSKPVLVALERILASEAPALAAGQHQALTWSLYRALQGRAIPYAASIRARLHRRDRDRRIREQFTSHGLGPAVLAERWGLSERQIRRIVHRRPT